MTVLVVSAVILLLIAVNGLYVAAEFSAVSAKRPRLAQMADDDDQLAGKVLAILEHPGQLDAYVSACQLGITVSSLALGFYGQSRVMALLQPWFGQFGPGAQTVFQAVGATAILLVLTVLQVVLGELIPKNVGLQYPERLAVLTARPMLLSMRLFRPLIALFNGSVQLLLRLFGIKLIAEHSHVHSPEEIVMLVEESGAGGLLDTEERRLLVNTLQLRELTARKVLIPRNRMVAAPVDQSCNDMFRLLATSPHSRLPIFADTIDNIIGVVHLKDLLRAHYLQRSNPAPQTQPWDVRAIMHPISHVPDSVEIGQIMALMQRAHLNLVIVVDEYGGTAGMITIEDLIEEIIGEFEDEFDAENPPVSILANNRIMIRGDVLVEDINDALGLLLPSEGIDTIGGLMFKEAGAIPSPGALIMVGGIDFRIERVQNNGIVEISFVATDEQVEMFETLAANY